MKIHVDYLKKRRILMMGIVVGLAIISVLVSINFHFQPTLYFDGKYNFYFLSFLILYKLIELPIIYYFLLHRHILHMKKNGNYEERFEKIKKHTKLLLFLIPQGNTVFGIIAYKISGNVYYFLLFSSIAIITLIFVKPNKLLL